MHKIRNENLKKKSGKSDAHCSCKDNFKQNIQIHKYIGKNFLSDISTIKLMFVFSFLICECLVFSAILILSNGTTFQKRGKTASLFLFSN